MIRGIVFDMDGLLFDSERIVQRAWEEAGKALGIPCMGEHIYQTLGMNRKGRNEYFARAIGQDFPFEEFGRRNKAAFARIVEQEGLPMKIGARELLEYVKAEGYKIGIATSSSGDYARGNLTQAHIYEYFDGGVFGDMVTKAKPDPEIYLAACESIVVEPGNCMALEDSPAGIRSASRAGMVPVMVPDLVEPTEEIRKMAYAVCKDLWEVRGLLEKLKS
ncbi:MAG TPA: HAD family phosphatase [Candidatus Dorea gallistercoris]|uniref:HAD family phosphatase n=1 Tax=Candidatus Dorea gallistercoris TaxID=2838542 RepID=A0A9D1RAS0_9FIRM|nr:HAD family phosphatase [Candidatus Dorea gallistercoris]